MDKNRFLGTWELISFEIRFPDGNVLSPWGDNLNGILMYDAENRFSAQLMRSNRKAFESNDQLKGTPDEIKDAFEGYGAYFGTYEIKDEKTVVHKVKGSLFPNWINGEQIRYYKFLENGLELSTPPMQAGGVTFNAVLTWERAA